MVLSNIRIEEVLDTAYLVCDLDSKNFSEKTVWFSVPKQYSDMLTPDLYDPFLVALLFPAMEKSEDIYIKGNVSKKIYKNIELYVQKILITYADYLKRIKIDVDGFGLCNVEKRMIGPGFSAGVDSFSTFYDHYVLENDPEYKINALFFFNVGSHGKFSNPNTIIRFHERFDYLKSFPEEVGIPYIPVDSNIHFFHEKYGHQRTHPMSLIAPLLVFQKVLSKYYVSNAYNYYEEKKYGMETFNSSMAEFCEFYLLPLLSPVGLEIISDGGQYSRTEKESRIINYAPVKKYLNVCVNSDDLHTTAKNCGVCSKCLRTLMAYESMGKLDELKNVFNINIYKKKSFKYKCTQRIEYNKSGFAQDNVDFARAKGVFIPPYPIAFLVCLPQILYRYLIKMAKKILGKNSFEKIKRKIKKYEN